MELLYNFSARILVAYHAYPIVAFPCLHFAVFSKSKGYNYLTPLAPSFLGLFEMAIS